MFVDKAKVLVKGGNGGNGAVSFRHEKFVDRGGPDGGDGGNGGSVVFRGSRNQNTLATFRYSKEISAEDGKAGFKQKKHGRSGKNLVVDVPVGTAVIDNDGNILADITVDKQEEIIAKGGRGGFGNAHFISSRRRAPRIAEKGEPGDELELNLELKMIAEVGLVGFPNAGKSTLLSRVTNAKPEIADYQFTTLIPNLGVADIDKKRSVLIADIPGLIEGASKGKGLGDEFLRHVERTKVLIHVIDAYREDISDAYKVIRKELKDYKVDLSNKPEVIAINKTDGLDLEMIKNIEKQLKKVTPKGTPIFAISATSGLGLKELIFKTAEIVEKTKEEEPEKDTIPVIKLQNTDEKWNVKILDESFMVSGRKIERFARRTDFDNPEGVERLRNIMRKMGIMHDLERKKIQPDQEIIVGTDKELIGRIKY